MQRPWGRELAGWAGALAFALIAAGQLAPTARATLLFRDGDSLVVGLIARSILEGASPDWALSSVLFLPESALFTALSAVLPLDVNARLAVAAILNVLLLYGVLRVVAGHRTPGSAPVAWSLVALGAFTALVSTESSASRDALELASLLLTTTYYSATVLGVLLTVGLARRFVDRGRRGRWLLGGIAVTGAVSTLSNPLYAAWGTVPLGVVTVVLAARAAFRRDGRRRQQGLALLAVLSGGTILGFVGRIPFAAWIANTGAGYVQPGRWAESLAGYTGLAAARLSTPGGVLATALVLGLLAAAVVLSRRAPTEGARLVAAVAWVMPLLVLVGAVALGTNAARYLQPLVFAPLLALVAHPVALRVPARLVRPALAVVAVVLLALGALGAPRLAAAAAAPDRDLRCVTDWVDASGRTGGGQFWTVRLPKLHLQDPARLVQLDHALNGYAWLVDRTDFDVGEVSFLVEDAQTVPWVLPAGAVPEAIAECGRYRILDFRGSPLRIGPAHS
ncbi:hypothetical protein [Microbacterium sp. p3-SID336]|uniref:hypothetical protein n=1 Tax=Microbacterium sp. p3-SID336 TaxID=2916212 RepID=UPI0021A87702|nr:hypothetical protein [Microbacterium sp. p3-SID336]MCT1478618.1 hypothetical protein [Microbacterium sp. p3-SID336]